MTIAIGRGETLDWSQFDKYRVTFLPRLIDWSIRLLISRNKDILRGSCKETESINYRRIRDLKEHIIRE